MSYNIDTWKTKSLDNFSIPMKQIKQFPHTNIMMIDNGVVIDGPIEMFEIIGTVEEGVLNVTSINFSGEGSGSIYEDFLNMLKESKGLLIASQVWEGGDSITKITVRDGFVVESEIEI